MCAKGHYCVAGVVAKCPAGRYGATEGLGSATCSGLCAAGRYGDSDGLDNAACSGPCDAGYWCPPGSTTPQARVCPAGTFSSGGSGTVECEGPCQAGYDQPCAAATIIVVHVTPVCVYGCVCMAVCVYMAVCGCVCRYWAALQQRRSYQDALVAHSHPNVVFGEAEIKAAKAEHEWYRKVFEE